MLPVTVHVPYQSGTSSSPSSSPSSGSDPGPVVDISILVLKPSFSRRISFHSHLSLTLAHLMEYDHSVTGGGSVGECGRLTL